MVPDNFLGLDKSVVTCVDKCQDFYVDTLTDFYVDIQTDFVYFLGPDISKDFYVDM